MYFKFCQSKSIFPIRYFWCPGLEANLQTGILECCNVYHILCIANQFFMLKLEWRFDEDFGLFDMQVMIRLWRNLWRVPLPLHDQTSKLRQMVILLRKMSSSFANILYISTKPTPMCSPQSLSPNEPNFNPAAIISVKLAYLAISYLFFSWFALLALRTSTWVNNMQR